MLIHEAVEQDLTNNEPMAGENYGGMDFDRQLGDMPEWLDLNDQNEGEIKQAEEELDQPNFMTDTPQDAYGDQATKQALDLFPDNNPTKVVGREYLLVDKSELINDAATQFQTVARRLLPAIMTRDPVLSRIIIGEVQPDGHVAEGKIIWALEISASNQPGVNRAWTSMPTKRMRIEIPVNIKEGQLVEPNIFTLASNRVYPLTVEGCQLALQWHERPLVRKAPPKVELSQQQERDYRAF